MSKYLSLIVLIFTSSALIGQNRQSLIVESTADNNVWISQDEAINVNQDEFLESIISELNLDPQTSFEEQVLREDYMGMRHSKYQQTIHDIGVEGGVLMVHEMTDGSYTANGKLVSGLTKQEPRISFQKALNVVRTYLNAPLYSDDPAKENWIKDIMNDDQATFYPVEELVYAHPEFGQVGEEYTLCWKIDVFSKHKIERQTIYVDANNGEVLFQLDGCSGGCAGDHSETCVVEPQGASGYTRYVDVRSFTCDSISDSVYILRDATRGGGIETYDMNENTEVDSAVDFFSDTLIWDLRNGELDEAAIDAHWGASKTYDYLMEKFGWSSYDGKGSPMRSYVHWDVNWFNAVWNGMFARFGDGPKLPLTYIDIVAHEYSHGWTGNTSGLIYRNESGALNESFSDILGVVVKFYALDTMATWELGVPFSPFRDMSNPKAKSDPDTYLGEHWVRGSEDNGGVHSNSGVQNYWFYLLSEGDTGRNDYGYNYDVSGLGMDKAMAIAFRNNTYYLFDNATYFDARLGSIQAAEDLFGPCSPEVNQVVKAWAAVGIGIDTLAEDISLLEVQGPLSACDLSSSEALTFTFKYNPNGCNEQLFAGDSIKVGYRVDDQVEVEEFMVLSQDVFPSDTLIYTFSTEADFINEQEYEVDFWSALPTDIYAANDTIFDFVVHKPVPITDKTIVSFKNLRLVNDTFYTVLGQNAMVRINPLASSPGTGILGLHMHGRNGRIRNVNIPMNEEENFTKNANFESKICFCVDAFDWEGLDLSFDLKQTFSSAYLDILGMDIPDFATSLRVTVDGQQVGDQFHPETYLNDTFRTVRMNLDTLVGESFTLCFEGKHFIESKDDPGETAGDNTYLDNIKFEGKNSVGNNNLVDFPFTVMPNPAKDYIQVAYGQAMVEDYQIQIMDVSGKIMQFLKGAKGDLQSQLNIDGLSSGIYTLRLISNNSQGVHQIIIE